MKENPYCLTRDIQGIGFISADRIAQNLGIDSQSIIRAKAGLIYVLSELTQEGHVYYPEDALVKRAGDILKVDAEVVQQALEELRREKDIVREEIGDIENKRGVYLGSFYVAEVGIAEHMKALVATRSNVRPIKAEKAIEWVQEKLGIELAPETAGSH